jgi:hypothetical protein
LAFFGFINIYCLRVNLSVALVAMVNTTYIRELNKATAAAAALDGGGETSVVDDVVCAADGNSTKSVEVDVR